MPLLLLAITLRRHLLIRHAAADDAAA